MCRPRCVVATGSVPERSPWRAAANTPRSRRRSIPPRPSLVIGRRWLIYYDNAIMLTRRRLRRRPWRRHRNLPVDPTDDTVGAEQVRILATPRAGLPPREQSPGSEAHGVLYQPAATMTHRFRLISSCSGSTRASRAAKSVFGNAYLNPVPADPRVESEDDGRGASRTRVSPFADWDYSDTRAAVRGSLRVRSRATPLSPCAEVGPRGAGVSRTVAGILRRRRIIPEGDGRYSDWRVARSVSALRSGNLADDPRRRAPA